MKNRKIIGIIPARYHSSRLPAKALVDIGGKSMIQRVYEQASKASVLSDLYVATDDERIESVVKGFGGQVVMTADTHRSGTDRCAEACKIVGAADIVVNIQGDEPFLHPQQIVELCALFDKSEVQIATLVKKIESNEVLFDTNTPKVVIEQIGGKACYFSRNCIPYLRDVAKEDYLLNHTFYKHIGIYAYRTAVLNEIVQLKPSTLELAERLEQLRWLENGFPIYTTITEHESVSIDTPKDLEYVRKHYC